MAKEKTVKPGEINNANPPLHVLHAEQRELEKQLASVAPGVDPNPELVSQLEAARQTVAELMKANEDGAAELAQSKSELETALACIAELEAAATATPPAPEEKKA